MPSCVDEKLSSAFHDVPIPAGLAQRLLDRLAAERAGETEQSAAEHDVIAARPASILVAALSRRWLLAGGGLLAAAAALLIAVWLGANRGRDFSEDLVLDEAIQAFDAAIGQKGRLLTEHSPPSGYSISSVMMPMRGLKWRPIEGFLGCDGIVYQLPGRAGAKAALFVVAAGDNEQLAASPALEPFTTGGYCASAWQENGLLYVLVVQGDAATYNSYLSLPSEPVA